MNKPGADPKSEAGKVELETIKEQIEPEEEMEAEKDDPEFPVSTDEGLSIAFNKYLKLEAELEEEREELL